MEINEILSREKRWRKDFPWINKYFVFSKYLKNGKNHLDFGCGLGIVTKILSEKFPGILFLGYDIDKDKIKLSKQRYKGQNLKFDAKVDTEFDSVSAIFVFHEISENIKSVIKKISNSVKKEGILMIMDYKKTSKKEFLKYYNSAGFKGTFEEEYKEHNKWTMEEFEKICESCGFKTLRLKEVDTYWFIYIGQKR